MMSQMRTIRTTGQSTKEKIQSLPRNSAKYVWNLFPFLDWLPRYNRTWLLGDLIAGVTVGFLAVPQALAYAKLAGLPLEFGLYTAIVGVFIYWLFATTKDVTIGPTAVLSQLTGQLLATHNSGTTKTDPVSFLVSVAFLSGLFELAIGFFNLGIIVDFIPTPVIIGFTSGAGITIIIGQLAGLLGIAGINTNDVSYLVLFNTLKNFGSIKLDAVIGFSALAVLIIFRIVSYYGVKRGYSWFSWVGHASNAFVIVLFTLISYAINVNNSKPAFRLVGTVPRGLTYFKVPTITDFNGILSASIATVVVSILEHLAISKSFGRLNGYNVDINQEIIALGATNTLGAFLGGFAATGSFSRSSVKSRSGVKTPLAGVVTGVIILLAAYLITPAFYYIPNALLSAVIINAIADLISRPVVVKQLWEIEVLDFLAFTVAFLVTIFSSIENAIYSSVSFAVLVLLYRIARPNVFTLVRDQHGSWSGLNEIQQDNDSAEYVDAPPGIAVFRIEESLSYPNSNFFQNHIIEWVQTHTRYNGKAKSFNDQLWNKKNVASALPTSDSSHSLPVLEAVIFDFSAVNGVDATGVQTLVDLKRELESFAGGPVLFYFAHAHVQLRSVLEYFLLNTRPTFEVAPVIANVQKVSKSEQVSDEITFQDLDQSYSKQFIFRTIDQALSDAQQRLKLK